MAFTELNSTKDLIGCFFGSISKAHDEGGISEGRCDVTKIIDIYDDVFFIGQSLLPFVDGSIEICRGKIEKRRYFKEFNDALKYIQEVARKEKAKEKIKPPQKNGSNKFNLSEALQDLVDGIEERN